MSRRRSLPLQHEHFGLCIFLRKVSDSFDHTTYTPSPSWARFLFHDMNLRAEMTLFRDRAQILRLEWFAFSLVPVLRMLLWFYHSLDFGDLLPL